MAKLHGVSENGVPAWASKNPNVGCRNPEGVRTGEYGDTACRAELLSAAAELWRTSGKE
jgi:hypothetical protein